MPPGVSEYERQRLRNIERNQIELVRLGVPAAKPRITKPRISKPKTSPIKRARSPQRRSARHPGKEVSYQDMDEGEPVSTDSEDSYSEDSEDDPKPRRQRVTIKPKAASKAASGRVKSGEAKGLLVIEDAKTGRSTCRKCKVIIERGQARVGMEAWIMGRQSVTWQHPTCFASNLSVAVDATGRAKCQATSEPFVKGEPKIGFNSHKSTRWVRLEIAWKLLQPVVELLSVFDPTDISGLSELSDTQQQMVTSQLCESTRREDHVERKQHRDATAAAPAEAASQPALGVKTETNGKAEWKFGGQVFQGELIPDRETGTHCFARTHKGNTKTLAKGKDYWYVVFT